VCRRLLAQARGRGIDIVSYWTGRGMRFPHVSFGWPTNNVRDCTFRAGDFQTNDLDSGYKCTGRCLAVRYRVSGDVDNPTVTVTDWNAK
jgi:hypothetical protein